MRVVIDTNAFVADLGMRGPLRVLLDATRQADITLVVPEVVMREVLKHFRIRYLEEVRRYAGSARVLADLGVDPVARTELPDVEDALIAYEARLRTRLHDAGALVALLPTVTHDDVLERAMTRRKPFKESGAGYQDTLIWLSVLEYVDLGQVAMISENVTDFAERFEDRWVLGTELRAELAQRGFSEDAVNFFPSVREFIRARHLESDEQDLSDLRALLIDDDATRRYLELEIAADLIRYPDLLSGELLEGADAETSHIEGLWVEDVDIVDAYEFEEEDDLYVILRARVVADVDFELDRRDAESLPREERALISVWSEGVATGRKRIAVNVDVEVVVDRNSKVASLTVTGADAIP